MQIIFKMILKCYIELFNRKVSPGVMEMQRLSSIGGPEL